MEWFIQLAKIEATREELDKALTDALETQNPLLVRIALAMGADPLKGGGPLLAYASHQGDLDLTKKLIPTINPSKDADKKYLEEATVNAAKRGHQQILEEIFWISPATLPVAMKAALESDQPQMAEWLLSKGAVLHVDRECIKHHFEMVKHLLSSNSKVNTCIEKEALLEVVYMENGAEGLEMLLDALKKETPSNLEKWLVPIAEKSGESGRLECLKVTMKFGVDMRSVSTRYCTNKEIRAFMKANGSYVCEY